jgi:hypothetical protein
VHDEVDALAKDGLSAVPDDVPSSFIDAARVATQAWATDSDGLDREDKWRLPMAHRADGCVPRDDELPVPHAYWRVS